MHYLSRWYNIVSEKVAWDGPLCQNALLDAKVLHESVLSEPSSVGYRDLCDLL